MVLTVALLLDAAFGEPDWLWRRAPHPAVVMGRALDALEARANRGGHRRLKGAFALLMVILGAGLVGWGIASVPGIGDGLAALAAAILLAQRSLIDHVAAVAAALREGLAPARVAVARIVGRDPETLDEAGVARAAIESAAENFSDGVVAPVFWFAVAGLPGMAIYKAVNTADSMIGHRTPRHEEFGWAAARLDDVMNLIPARLACGLIAFAGFARMGEAWRVATRDARRHRSPNAGWPEAAMAGALDLALAGPRIYGGRVTEDPWLNSEGRRDAGPDDVARACAHVWGAWAALVALAALCALVTVANA